MIRFREMLQNDVKMAAELEASLFPDPWSEEAFLQALKNSYTFYVVGYEENEIVAQCGYYNLGGEGEILNVAVLASRQRQGIAEQMLKYLMEHGRKNGVESFTLEVRAGNLPAIALYEKLGFVKQGMRPGFYQNPKEDAVIMNKVGDLC